MSSSRRRLGTVAIGIAAGLACAWLAAVMAIGLNPGILGPAGIVARQAPAMLGLLGPRTWLVLLQNPAEARGTGGLVGGYVVLRANRGHMSVVATGTSADLARQSIPPGAAAPEQAALWGPILTQWNGFNVTPDFPVAASLARAGMAQMGIDVDGVIAIDPITVAALMRATGPVTAAGRTVSADTVARYFLIHEYLDFTDGRERDDAGMALAEAIMDRGLAGGPAGALTAVVRGAVHGAVHGAIPALGTAIQDGHLRVWSADPHEEAALAALPIGGAVPGDPGPTVVVAFTNAAGSKADAFVTTAIDYDVSTCTGEPSSSAHLAVSAHNGLPAGMPVKDYGRRDRSDAPAGSTALLVHVLGPVDAGDARATRDGQPVEITRERLGARPVWWTTLEIERGRTSSLRIDFTEPAAPGATPRVLSTPMVHATTVTVGTTDECTAQR